MSISLGGVLTRAWLPLTAILVALGFSEVLVRVFFPQELTPLLAWAECCHSASSDLLIEDPHYGWLATPGYVGTYARGTELEINSLGFRDREYGPNRSGEIRVLSLGDSYAFGYGVELRESYPKVLEGLLRERFPGAEISVISAGLTGYNTQHSIMEFARLRPLLDPDLVVATFVAGNDVAENAIFERQLRTRLQSPVGFLGSSSHLARLFLRATFAPRFFAANRNRKNIELTITLLDELSNQFEQTGLPFAILTIPARHQVRPSVHPGAEFVDRVGATGYLFRHNGMIRDHMEPGNGLYLDAYPVLASRDSVDHVYFEDDNHTNALGHQLIAELVFQGLMRKVEALVEEADPGSERD